MSTRLPFLCSSRLFVGGQRPAPMAMRHEQCHLQFLINDIHGQTDPNFNQFFCILCAVEDFSLNLI